MFWKIIFVLLVIFDVVINYTDCKNRTMDVTTAPNLSVRDRIWYTIAYVTTVTVFKLLVISPSDVIIYQYLIFIEVITMYPLPISQHFKTFNLLK